MMVAALVFPFTIVFIIEASTTRRLSALSLLFFFTNTATTEIYTLSLHDALPISAVEARCVPAEKWCETLLAAHERRSEEHTSELQSRPHLVCRLLLEKKKKKKKTHQNKKKKKKKKQKKKIRS